MPFEMSFARKTLPNAPEPKVFIMVKEEKLTLLVVISFNSFVRFYFDSFIFCLLSSFSSCFDY